MKRLTERLCILALLCLGLFSCTDKSKVADNDAEEYALSDTVWYDSLMVIKDKLTGRYGLANSDGHWLIEPDYTQVERVWSHWAVCKDDTLWGLYDNNYKKILDCDYLGFDDVIGSADIMVFHRDYRFRKHNSKGECLNYNQYYLTTTDPLYYERREEGQDTLVTVEAECCQYVVSHHAGTSFGLMNKQGEYVTPACYNSIKAIAANMFLCSKPNNSTFADCQYLIDDKGRELSAIR